MEKRTQVLDLCIDRLRRGISVCLFPEGTRSSLSGAEMLPFQKGAFLIAQQAGVRIVPMSISHTGEMMPTDALFPLYPTLGYTRIHIHPPVSSEGKTIKELSNEVRRNSSYVNFLASIMMYSLTSHFFTVSWDHCVGNREAGTSFVVISIGVSRNLGSRGDNWCWLIFWGILIPNSEIPNTINLDLNFQKIPFLNFSDIIIFDLRSFFLKFLDRSIFCNKFLLLIHLVFLETRLRAWTL